MEREGNIGLAEREVFSPTEEAGRHLQELFGLGVEEVASFEEEGRYRVPFINAARALGEHDVPSSEIAEIFNTTSEKVFWAWQKSDEWVEIKTANWIAAFAYKAQKIGESLEDTYPYVEMREISFTIAKTQLRFNNVSVEDLRSDSMTFMSVVPRSYAMKQMWKSSIFTQVRIGRFFNRDHSTVINALSKDEKWMSKSIREWKEKYYAEKEKEKRLEERKKAKEKEKAIDSIPEDEIINAAVTEVTLISGIDLNEMRRGNKRELSEARSSVVDLLLGKVSRKKINERLGFNVELQRSRGEFGRLKKKMATFNAVFAVVESHYPGVSIEDLLGNRRPKNIVDVRAVAAYLLQKMTDMGPSAIGKTLGGRDHSTAINLTDKAEFALEENEEFAGRMAEMESEIRELIES